MPITAYVYLFSRREYNRLFNDLVAIATGMSLLSETLYYFVLFENVQRTPVFFFRNEVKIDVFLFSFVDVLRTKRRRLPCETTNFYT